MSQIGEPPSDQPPPSEEQVRIIIAQAIEQVFRQSVASEKVLLAVHAQLTGAQAGIDAVAKVVDSNQDEAHLARVAATQKEFVSFIYDRSQQYVAVIVAGAFAAFFATYSIVAPRMSDQELYLSALLMTISLSVFVFYEVFNLSWTSWLVMTGGIEKVNGYSRPMKMAWGAALLITIGTAVPAIAISIWAYLRGLGVLC